MEPESRESIEAINRELCHETLKADVWQTIYKTYGMISIAEIIESLETIKQTLSEIEVKSKEQE